MDNNPTGIGPIIRCVASGGGATLHGPHIFLL